MTTLHAPFPYYGGKRRIAPDVWVHFGDDAETYAEPFAGSLAVLLGAPYVPAREVVCDTDGHICNFWRAIRFDPDAVAYWADWPTVHHDLMARHRWLIEWRRENAQRLLDDADWYDVKAAGWWVWGISNWIGGQWCIDRDDPQDRRPLVEPTATGAGVSAQREHTPPVHDQIPHIHDQAGGGGVQVQRGKIPAVAHKAGGRGVQAQRQFHDKRPYMRDRDGAARGVQAVDRRPFFQKHGGGQGVSIQRTDAHRQRLAEWFNALAERLARVVILNRSWESALTPTILGQTPTSPKKPTAVFLDPPYVLGDRKADIYQSDVGGGSTDTARASYEWAVEHGANPQYRIAYCCTDGNLPVPDGWTVLRVAQGGVRQESRRAAAVDAIYLSPYGSQRRLL